MKMSINSQTNPELIRFVHAVRSVPSFGKDDYATLYVGYWKKSLICMTKQEALAYHADSNFYENESQSYTVHTLEKIIDIEEEKDNNNYYHRHNYTSYKFCDGHWDANLHREVGIGDKVKLIPGTEEAFKKDFPYAPYEDFKRSVKLRLENDGRTYRALSESYILANFIGLYAKYPQLEMMVKSDLKSFALDWMEEPENDSYRRSFGKGSNLSEITTMPNWLWKKLIANGIKLDRWEFIRIWNKQILSESKKIAKEKAKENIKTKEKDIRGFDEATVDAILNLDIRDANTLKKIKHIINSALDENGERMFTIRTLFNYLERIDMYQAVPAYQSIDIISDYLRMCKDLEVVPRLDSDSIKREHDVTARNHNIWYRQKREAMDAERAAKEGGEFRERSRQLEQYEFKKGNYIAIVPKEIKDLINEGKNNHNCVASYVQAFIKGRSNIFFIRHADNPEKSYITIELTESCENRKQAFLASNERITLDADWEFIQDWLENNKALNAKLGALSFANKCKIC